MTLQEAIKKSPDGSLEIDLINLTIKIISKQGMCMYAEKCDATVFKERFLTASRLMRHETCGNKQKKSADTPHCKHTEN